MSFIPKISVSISGNRCRCCDNTEKPQPKDLVVFYNEKTKKFMAVPRYNSPIESDENIIKITKIALEDFMKKTYPLGAQPDRQDFHIITPRQLPSLDEVYKIEEEAQQIFKRESTGSLDSRLAIDPSLAYVSPR